jgi:hypothetical protein
MQVRCGSDGRLRIPASTRSSDHQARTARDDLARAHSSAGSRPRSSSMLRAQPQRKLSRTDPHQVCRRSAALGDRYRCPARRADPCPAQPSRQSPRARAASAVSSWPTLVIGAARAPPPPSCAPVSCVADELLRQRPHLTARLPSLAARLLRRSAAPGPAGPRQRKTSVNHDAERETAPQQRSTAPELKGVRYCRFHFGALRPRVGVCSAPRSCLRDGQRCVAAGGSRLRRRNAALPHQRPFCLLGPSVPVRRAARTPGPPSRPPPLERGLRRFSVRPDRPRVAVRERL